MRVALKLAYLGTDYHGFQTQPGVPTIEGKLMKALKETGAIKNPSKARYAAAGRTDKGVHALGQVIAFDTENIDAAMPRALNSSLSNIWVYAWARVDVDFNARMSAMEREYRYILWAKGLDISRIKDSLSVFLGRHDFRNFSHEEKEKSTTCDIRKLSIQEQGHWIFIDMAASRFMLHMVRIIATALKLIGMCEKDKVWLTKMLDCSINDKLEPLEAQGLILKKVKYPDIKWNIDTYARGKALVEIHEFFMQHETTAIILELIENGMQ
jgi:tRNA pseudouridine38-40 synthase